MSRTLVSNSLVSPTRSRLRQWSSLKMITPALLTLLVFYYFPLLKVILISISDPRIGFSNYAQLLSSGTIHRVVWTTIRICALTTVLCLVLGYFVSYSLVRARPAIRRVMLLCILLPLWVSALVRAFAWVSLLRREGFINSSLLALGIVHTPLELVWNEVGVIIGMTHYMLPYAILPMYASMSDVDQRILMAARGLGGRSSQVFWRIFFPLTVPGVATAGMLVFVYSLGFFITPAILGGGKTLMIAEYIRLQIVELLRWGLGTMLSVTMVLTILASWGLTLKLVGTQAMFRRSST